MPPPPPIIYNGRPLMDGWVMDRWLPDFVIDIWTVVATFFIIFFHVLDYSFRALSQTVKEFSVPSWLDGC